MDILDILLDILLNPPQPLTELFYVINLVLVRLLIVITTVSSQRNRKNTRNFIFIGMWPPF